MAHSKREDFAALATRAQWCQRYVGEGNVAAGCRREERPFMAVPPRTDTRPGIMPRR
jgi:hypothetical protein